MTAQQSILAILSQRPATMKDMLAASKKHRVTLQMKLTELQRLGVIKREAIYTDAAGRPAFLYEVAA